ncbi:MAG: hypothetical protein HY040_27855 [Planctomycetes bacterium]|nr:hypothetical protein [Planctomycetota bacterium]
MAVEVRSEEEKLMPVAGDIQDLNRDLAERINREARSNPQSPYANKFVGIANGQVVVVADDLDEMSRQLRKAEPDLRRCFWVEASRDYDEVHQIWGWVSGAFDGIACFSFLNRFHYGNFGNPGSFGLEC